MFYIRYVKYEDKSFWLSMDNHMINSEFEKKVRDKEGYVMFDEKIPIGVMRYNLFWDNTPFLNYIYIKDDYQRKGYGKHALENWESDMKKAGFKMVFTSTQVDENAQHFYRKLRYKDCGCLVLNECPLEQPMEMFLYKIL